MSTPVVIHPAERNVTAYRDGAREVADQLRDRGWAEILFTPGDATAYPFIILPKHRTVACVGGERNYVSRNDYLVILAASFGGTYQWGGQSMHWDYCAAKWTTDGLEWTGRVVCSLLNALSPLLPTEAAP